MRDYSLYVFDLDGVVYRGNEAIPGARDAIQRLCVRGKIVRYLTNNSSKTREDYATKLRSLGFAVKAGDIYSSASATANYLKELGAESAFVIGEQGLIEELAEKGVAPLPNGAAWVVVGICRAISYEMIDTAQRLIRGGSHFIATNPDPTYPDEGGAIRPGAGVMVAAVATAAGRGPDAVIGKPEPTLLHQIWAETGASPSQTLLIGDRTDTDILCAHQAGCDSALVLTGVSAEPAADSHQPTYVLNTLNDLPQNQ